MLKTGKLLIMDRRYLTKINNKPYQTDPKKPGPSPEAWPSSESLGLKRKLKLSFHSKATVTETNKENCQI
jgi:hypothetical protein